MDSFPSTTRINNISLWHFWHRTWSNHWWTERNASGIAVFHVTVLTSVMKLSRSEGCLTIPQPNISGTFSFRTILVFCSRPFSILLHRGILFIPDYSRNFIIQAKTRWFHMVLSNQKFGFTIESMNPRDTPVMLSSSRRNTQDGTETRPFHSTQKHGCIDKCWREWGILKGFLGKERGFSTENKQTY